MRIIYVALLALLLPFFASATPTITGPTFMCVGSMDSFSATPAGGTWSTATGSIATIVGPGVVYAVSTGTAVLTYTTSGSGMAIVTVTVSAAPTVGAISGSSTICVGSTTTYTDATSGGTWSSSNSAIASVNAATGVVTGVSAGTATISYGVTNACGTTYATRTITVSSGSVSAISGPGTVCVGASVTLTDATSGGVWTTSSSGIASVNATTGVVRGVSTGTAIITYSVSGACGSASAVHTIVVNAAPGYPSITGATSTYVGGHISLSAAVSGGSWSSSATSIATVNATSGYVTGVAPGYALINYMVSNSCGSSFDSILIHVTSSTGLAQHNAVATSFSTYPNPTTGQLNINWSNPITGDAVVVISSVTGKTVLSTTVSLNNPSQNASLNLSTFENGIYFINIKADGVDYTNKIEITH